MHVSIMDPGLTSRVGHHFDQDLRVARALAALGHRVAVHANANVTPELVGAFAALGVSLHGTFRAGPYDRPKESEDNWDYWQAHAAVTCDDLATLAPTDVAFWPSLSPSHFLAMVRAPHGTRIIGGLDGQINWMSPLGAELLSSGREMTRRLAARLELGTYDRFVADAYRPILAGLAIRRLPVPYDGQYTPPAGKIGRVGFFGYQRSERGYALLPEIVDALVGRGLALTIQDSGENITTTQARPDVLTLGFVDDLPAVIATCDLIAWPSNPRNYGARTSGIVWEAIASGRPLVVPSGCLPTRIAFHAGAATFFHQHTARSVLRGIDEAIVNYADLARRADSQARHWRVTEGTARLAQALTAGKLPGWETT